VSQLSETKVKANLNRFIGVNLLSTRGCTSDCIVPHRIAFDPGNLILATNACQVNRRVILVSSLPS
jgi:hypothetical protein